jgi:hypothetical protein
MGPHIQPKARPWEPEVLSQYREPPPPHTGHMIRDDVNRWTIVGYECDTCGWVTRDRRRWRANWYRHRRLTAQGAVL